MSHIGVQGLNQKNMKYFSNTGNPDEEDYDSNLQKKDTGVIDDKDYFKTLKQNEEEKEDKGQTLNDLIY